MTVHLTSEPKGFSLHFVAEALRRHELNALPPKLDGFQLRFRFGVFGKSGTVTDRGGINAVEPEEHKEYIAIVDLCVAYRPDRSAYPTATLNLANENARLR
jgi:hypothetical protein